MNMISRIIVPVALISLASCNTSAPEEVKPEDTIPVRITVLRAETAPTQINVAGRFTTENETPLSFKTGGVIARILVEEGEAVKKGQVLATLNMTEADAFLQQAQLGYEKAKRDAERVQRLYNDSVATLEQNQNAETALGIAREQLEAVRFNSAYATIKAPDNGYVLQKMAAEGQVVAPGTPVLLTDGAGKGNWLLKAGISDREWSLVKAGDPALITIDAGNQNQFRGAVARKSEGADPLTGLFTVYIKINSDPAIRPGAGQFGKAVISTRSEQHLWKIPYEALLEGDGDEGYVFIARNDKTAQRCKIRINCVENNVVLAEGGLEEGDRLIVTGSAYLRDSSAIRIIR